MLLLTKFGMLVSVFSFFSLSKHLVCFFVDIFNVEIHYLSILLGGTSIVHCGIFESENIGVTS